jgi:hypothetical protein
VRDDIDPDRIGTRTVDKRLFVKPNQKDTRAEFHRNRPRCRGQFLYGLLTLADAAELGRRKAKIRRAAA